MRDSSKTLGNLLKIAAALLVAAALYEELKKPPEEREWHGKVANFVPYEFRPPTLERLRERLWNPQDPRIFTEHVFGVGWAINFHTVLQNLQRPEQEPSTAVIWDLDGVIADTAPHHFSAWRQVARERGMAFTKADFRQTFGKRNPEIIAEKFGTDIPAQEMDNLSQKKEGLFRRIAGQSVKPFPGVLDLLHSLKSAKWKMAVVSSTPSENIELLIHALEIPDLFDTIVADRDVSRGKPDPEGFLLAAERLGVAPSGCVVIEDAIAGVRAAKDAGMRCIAVTNTHPARRLEEADKVVDSLEVVTVNTLESLLQ